MDPYPDPVTGKIKDPFVDIKKDKFILFAPTQKEGGKDLEVTPVFSGVLKKNDANWETSEGVFMDINELKELVKKYKV